MRPARGGAGSDNPATGMGGAIPRSWAKTSRQRSSIQESRSIRILTTRAAFARGKAARTHDAPRSTTRRAWMTAERATRSVALLEEQAPARGSRSWCRSATGGCWRRRSRSSAARRCHGRRSRPHPVGDPTRSCAATRTSSTSACSGPGAESGLRRQRLRRDLPGPWEWDVKRLAASLEVAGRDRGFRSGARLVVEPCAAIARRWASSPRGSSTSGTRASTSTTALAELGLGSSARRGTRRRRWPAHAQDSARALTS